MEEQLRQVFEDVSDWLKFAERKNATLLAGNLAGVYGVGRLLLGDSSVHEWVEIGGWTVVGLLGFSSLVCLLSFLPQVEIPPFSQTGSPNSNDNLLFYSDIAPYEPETYLEEFAEWHNASSDSFSALELSYASQIVANARIVTTKFRHFRVAMWTTFVGFLFPIVLLVIYLLSR